jgi:cation:H+ antiporter
MAILPVPVPPTLAWAAVGFGVSVVLLLFAAIRFEQEAEALSTHYGLPPLVQGSVVVAVGSSMPELFSVIVTALTGQFDLGVGTVVGSAIFNIAMIPALSSFLSDWEGATDRLIIYKEAQFYLLAIAAIFVMFALAVIYAPVDDRLYTLGELRFWYVLVPLLLYLLYILTQYFDTLEDHFREPRPPASVRRSWAIAILSLLLILVAVEEMVISVTLYTDAFGVQEFLAGAVVLAAVTSLPDLIMSVNAARENRADTAMANVMGSNTFDLLVVIPVGVLLTGSVIINFTIAVPMFAALTVLTITLLIMLLWGLSISTREAALLMLLYALFVLLVVGEITGAVDLIPGV